MNGMQINTEPAEDNPLGGREKEEKEFFVYILRCRDNTFYTGYSDDLAKRLKAHNSGRGAKIHQKPSAGGNSVL